MQCIDDWLQFCLMFHWYETKTEWNHDKKTKRFIQHSQIIISQITDNIKYTFITQSEQSKTKNETTHKEQENTKKDIQQKNV